VTTSLNFYRASEWGELIERVSRKTELQLLPVTSHSWLRSSNQWTVSAVPAL